MGEMASEITSLTIVYSTVYSDTAQSKHQSSASLAFVWGIHRGPVNSPHKWPVKRKMFPFDDVIMSEIGIGVIEHNTRPRHDADINAAKWAWWISDYLGIETYLVMELLIIFATLDIAKIISNHMSTLVPVMAWCHQATHNYPSQCGPKVMSPLGHNELNTFEQHLLNTLLHLELPMRDRMCSNV